MLGLSTTPLQNQSSASLVNKSIIPSNVVTKLNCYLWYTQVYSNEIIIFLYPINKTSAIYGNRQKVTS